MSRALIVIDMLRDFVEPSGALCVPDAEGILAAVSRELHAARRAGELVVFLCDAHDPEDREFERMGWPVHAVKGTRGAGVVDALAPQSGEEIVEKTTYSGFHGTRFAEVLSRGGTDIVRLVGCVTNICVLYTAADAAMRGFRVEVVRDAVAGLDSQDHAFALRQIEKVLGGTIVGGTTGQTGC
ncbi:MAG: cysteine hydrolase [Deltaproteobacteria bacterium]|nr:cysteine hydrolase [Deltaproteobacteria bacterium]